MYIKSKYLGPIIIIMELKMEKLNLKLKKSYIFSQAENSKLKLNIFSIIIIFFMLWGGGFILGRMIAMPIVKLISRETLMGESFSETLRKLLVCGIQILMFFIWVKYVEKRSIKAIGITLKNSIKSYSLGAVIGLSSVSVITLILLALGQVKLKPVIIENQSSYIIMCICIMIAGWIVQSASEEIAMRGWLVSTLGRRYNPLTAIIVPGIIFGCIHLLNDNVTVLSFANLILSGVFFSLYFIISENIWGVCGLHFAWNFALGNIYGYKVSGFEPVGGTILKTTQTGSDFLTGGNFGPEGGFASTLVLLVGIIVLIYIVHNKK